LYIDPAAIEDSFANTSLIAGGHLKEIGTTHWLTPNTGATNTYGFNGRGASSRFGTDGTFASFQSSNIFWCSLSDLPNEAYYHYIVSNSARMGRYRGFKKHGYSIRLMRATALPHGTVGTYTGNDGKVYTTIVIGTQEWMSESLNETKFANGDPITIVTANTAWAALGTEAMCYYNNNIPPVSLLTSWSNIDFDVLTSSGANITNADESAGTYGHCKSNNIALTTGQTLYFDFYLTLVSGNLPRASLYKDNVFLSSVLITAGLNNLNFSITSDGDYAVGFISSNNASKFTALCSVRSSSSEGWSADATGAYAWYDNLIANKDQGALYNWFAVNNVAGLAYLTRNGVRETGWRVPLVADFNLLKSDIITVDSTEVSVDDDVSVDDTGISLGLGLKEIGTSHWTAGNGTDLFGFKAIGSGIRDFTTCVFSGLKLINRLWSSEADDASTSFSFLIDDSVTDASVDSQENGNGYSVRLVRDAVDIEPDPPDPPVPPTYPEVVPYTYGPMPEYRFYISTASSVSYEVFPLKFLSSALVYELEGDQVFYRRKFNGSLLFGTNSLVLDASGVSHNRKEDWDLFWAVEQTDPSEKLYLTITKDFGGVVDVYWDGYFATSEGKFDIDICTFEVTPIAIDDYTEVLEMADVQYNFLSTTDGVASMGTVTTTYDGDTINYTRMRWLTRIGSDNVLEFIAKQMIPTCTVESDFFTNAVNPITLADNRLLYLTIAQKSDITRYLSTDPATSAMLSWNELMDILWGMFQVKWTYNLITNVFTVEHNSIFTHPAGIDLRQQLSCVATNKYQYLKEKMPKYESFSMMEADGINFVGTPIWYDSAGVNQDVSSNTTEFTIPVVTDLEYILKGGGAGSDEGFVILCNDFDGASYNVRGEFGRYDNSYYALNMDLSIANLEHDYFRHDRILPTGYLNGQYVTFFTTRKTKQQECSAILCEEIDPMGEITTELGETYFGGAKAIIKTASLNPSGEMKFVLLYGPLPTVNPGVPDLFGVSAVPALTSTNDPDDTVTIEFTFTAPCPGDYTVRIQQQVYDNTGASHDLGAWETVIFLTGTLSYSFTPVYLHQIDYLAGWRVRLYFEYIGSEIDLFRGKTDPTPEFMYMIPYTYTIL